jgi:ankyrin repeat protein
MFKGNFWKNPGRTIKKTLNGETKEMKSINQIVKDIGKAPRKLIDNLNYYQDKINGDLDTPEGSNPTIADYYSKFTKDSGEDTLNEFVAAGFNLASKDDQGRTLLHIVCQNENFELVKVLLSKGVDVNAKTDAGLTPLHIVAANGNFSIMQELILHDANVNLQDKLGNTALHYAFHNSHHDIVGFLFKHDADAHIKNACGDMYHKGLAIHLEAAPLTESSSEVSNNDVQEVTNLETIVSGDTNTIPLVEQID